ncbi:MAG TPA: hypothetical protein VIF82_05805 [Burkholderiaceae bacterium]
MLYRTNKKWLTALAITPLFALAAPSDKDILDLIDARSAGAEVAYQSSDGHIKQIADVSKCTNLSMDEQWRQINRYIKQGNDDMAQAGGLVGAKAIAACALIKTKYREQALSKRIPDLGLDGWSSQIGSFLAASVIAGDSDKETADQAMTFLSYAKDHGKHVDDLINRIKLKLGTNEPSQDAPALTGTAVSIVGKLTSNSFSFEQQYLGKVIQATGKVLSIYGTNDRVTVRILGNMTKTKNQLSFRDSIECIVTNQEFISNVGKLSVDKNATVRGTYKKGSFGEIELKNCEVR